MKDYLQEKSDSGTQIVSILRSIQPKSNERPDSSNLTRFESSILSARREHPEIVILSGISWIISTEDYSFDLTILFPETPEEFDKQRQFEVFVGTLKLETDTLESVKKALSWLEKNAVDDDLRPVVISHSSRWLGESATEIVIPVAALMRVSEQVIGFPVFPAEDKGFTLQAPSLETLNSREEAWNQLLKRGVNILAATSSSQTTTDTPSLLTETWLQTNDPTPNGVLSALHSGAFYSGRGGIATELDFSVAINGVQQTVTPGESITVPAETRMTVSFTCKIPEQDMTGESNWLDSLELVCISESGVETLVENTIQLGDANHQWALNTPNGGIVIRACARRSVDGGEDFIVYTNPIRIESSPAWSNPPSLHFFTQIQSWSLLYWAIGPTVLMAIILFWIYKPNVSLPQKAQHERNLHTIHTHSKTPKFRSKEKGNATGVDGSVDWAPPRTVPEDQSPPSQKTHSCTTKLPDPKYLRFFKHLNVLHSNLGSMKMIWKTSAATIFAASVILGVWYSYEKVHTSTFEVGPPIQNEEPLIFPENLKSRPTVGIHDFEFIGGWRVPTATQPEWKTLAFSNGGLAVRLHEGTFKFYLTHHNHLGGPIQELISNGPQSAPHLPPTSWPLLEEGNFLGDLYSPARVANSDKTPPTCTAAFWDKENELLLTSGRALYAAPPPGGPFVCTANIANPDKVVADGPFPLKGATAQVFGGGFCDIPDWFADEYLGGKNLGVGFGGYCSGQGSTHGPSLLASSRDYNHVSMPTVTLLKYASLGSKNSALRERRPPDYSNARGVWSIDPDGPVGFWATDRVVAGPVWIDTPTKQGLCYWSLQGLGSLEYKRQNSTFGSPEVVRLYTYSPSELSKVASGELPPHAPRGKFEDWKNEIPGSVWGACWHHSSQTLFLLYKHSYRNGEETLPVIAAFKIR